MTYRVYLLLVSFNPCWLANRLLNSSLQPFQIRDPFNAATTLLDIYETGSLIIHIWQYTYKTK
jgi:hypothetical protein